MPKLSLNFLTNVKLHYLFLFSCAMKAFQMPCSEFYLSIYRLFAAKILGDIFQWTHDKRLCTSTFPFSRG